MNDRERMQEILLWLKFENRRKAEEQAPERKENYIWEGNMQIRNKIRMKKWVSYLNVNDASRNSPVT